MGTLLPLLCLHDEQKTRFQGPSLSVLFLGGTNLLALNFHGQLSLKHPALLEDKVLLGGSTCPSPFPHIPVTSPTSQDQPKY